MSATLLVVFLLPMVGVQATDVSSGLAKCAAVEDSLQRLRCYDKLSESVKAAPPKKAAQTTKAAPAESHEEAIARLLQSIKDKQEGKPGESSEAILGKGAPSYGSGSASSSKSSTSSSSSAKGSTTKSKSTSTSTQCTATTQKGTRCKRMTKSGNRCWQH